jgi:hypothetical protein
MTWQPLRQQRRPIEGTMAHPLDNSLETLSNILYLLGRSLDDPARAEGYLDFADKVFAELAAKHSFRRAESPDADNLRRS